MKTRVVPATAVFVFGCCALLRATPSTTYWTPCVYDVQPYGVLHIGIDSYFTADKKAASGKQGDFPTDIGLTIGVLPFEKVQMEIGVDAFHPSDYPYLFNAKIGTPEGALFPHSPALNVGIFNVGTRKDATDYNVAHFVAGGALPFKLGRIHAGAYAGNDALLVSGDGKEEESGWMIGYDALLAEKKLSLDKLILAADYASGDNAVGGGGVGLYLYFTEKISLLIGPVWFNDETMNGHTKFTAQLDINL